MGRTALTLVPHQPPACRHTVLSRQPPASTPLAQSVNALTTPVFAHPAISTPVVQGVVVGVKDDTKLGSAPALNVGPSAARTSSPTHVVPPGSYPQGTLSSCYPDCLRKRNTPARNDVVAEDVDKELLLSPRDAPGAGREFTGLSAEIREPLKNMEESGTKDETWARLAEMAGFSLGGFGFFKTRLGEGAYNRERKATILLQFATDKAASRGGGLRAPLGIGSHMLRRR